MKDMLYAVYHQGPIKASHIDNAFNPQQILTTKLHKHGQARLE